MSRFVLRAFARKRTNRGIYTLPVKQMLEDKTFKLFQEKVYHDRLFDLF